MGMMMADSSMTEDDEIIERIAKVGHRFAYRGSTWVCLSEAHKEQHRKVARFRLAEFRKEGLAVTVAKKHKGAK
jgi:hypothetical protein